MTWQIFPVVVTATKDGYRRLPDSESADYAQQVVDGRMTLPDGPPAPLRLVSPADLRFTRRDGRPAGPSKAEAGVPGPGAAQRRRLDLIRLNSATQRRCARLG